MKFNTVLLALALTSVSSHSFAIEKPDTCPSADALKIAPFTMATCNLGSGCYVTGELNSLGTNYQWLVMMEINAEKPADALNLAKQTQPSLQLQSGPEMKNQYLMCNYVNNAGYKTYALYIPAEFAMPANRTNF